MKARWKRLDISREVLKHFNMDRYAMIALWRELPENVRLVGMDYDRQAQVFFMVFECPDFSEVDRIVGTLPKLFIQMDRHMLEKAEKPDGGEMARLGRAVALKQKFGRETVDLGGEMVASIDHDGARVSSMPNVQSLPRCGCDVAYTGAHRKDCKNKIGVRNKYEIITASFP